MFMFVVFALAVSSVFAGGYDSAPALLRNSYAAEAPLLRKALLPAGPITAAIQSTRSYELVPVALNYEAPVAQVIEVGPNVQPVDFIFRTQSSPLNLRQVHTPTAPQFESTRSEDQPSVLTHENFKTIVQNYNEVVQPIRKITQRVNPVEEQVNTLIAKGEEYRAAPVAYEQKALPAALPVLSKSDY